MQPLSQQPAKVFRAPCSKEGRGLEPLQIQQDRVQATAAALYSTAPGPNSAAHIHLIILTNLLRVLYYKARFIFYAYLEGGEADYFFKSLPRTAVLMDRRVLLGNTGKTQSSVHTWRQEMWEEKAEEHADKHF